MRIWLTLLVAGVVATAALRPSPALAGAPRCSESALVASLVGAGVGTGHAHAHVYLRNAGSRPCTLEGYLGFRLETAQRRVQPSRVVRGSTYFERDAGPREIVLDRGARAVADLAWTEIAGPDEPHSGACEPPSAWLEVMPPGARTQLLVPFRATVCDRGHLDTTALSKAPTR